MSFAKRVPPGSDRREKALESQATERRDFSTRGGRVITIIASVFLAVIVWIAFGQALGHEFVNYDDDTYVVGNPRITKGLTPADVQWAFTHAHGSNWHPLTTISHMLDCHFYGLQPWGHHLTNILLHAAAAILLFLALRKLTGALWPSLFVAAVFAVHPLRVESVAWVSERKDVLSGVFFALTLWAYTRYALRSGPSFRAYITVVVLFALGLMCKPTLVTLPFVLLLLDYWPLGRGHRAEGRDQKNHTANFGREWSSLTVEKIPLFLLSAAACVATLLAQKHSLDASLKPPLGERAGNAIISYAAYLGQMIWPARLAVLYPYPEGNLKLLQVVLAFLLLLIISAAFFLWRRKYPFLLIGWMWYVGMLVPMIGIVQVGKQVRADRYTYLPQIGLYLLAAWGAMELFGRWRRSREVLGVTVLLIIIALTTRSYFQTSYWRTSEMLWKHAIASTSDNYIAHTNLAFALSQSGRYEEVITECQKALRIKPDFATAHNNLGLALIQNEQSSDGARRQDGAVDEAIIHYRRALQTRPDFPQARSNLRNALLQKGRVDEAIGKNDEALKEFNEALRINGNSAELHCHLGVLLGRMGHREEAVVHLAEALRLKPDYEYAKEQLRELGATVPQ